MSPPVDAGVGHRDVVSPAGVPVRRDASARFPYRSLRGIVWLALLAGVAGLLHGPVRDLLAVGSPALPGGGVALAPIASDPLRRTAEALRWGSLTAVWYLLVVTVVGGTARRRGSPPWVSCVDRLTLPVVRRLLSTVAGVSVATAIGTASVAGVLRGAEVSPFPVDLVAHHPADPLVRPAGDRAVASDDVRAGPGNAASVTAPVVVWSASPRHRLRVQRLVPDTGTSPSNHVVRAGDSLWSIAAATLTSAAGQRPGDGEVLDYWREFIELNRSRLVVPDDPDLVFPGQELVLPPVGPDAANGTSR